MRRLKGTFYPSPTTARHAPRGTGKTRQKREPETAEQKVNRITEEIKTLEKEKRRIDLEIKKRNLDLEFLQEEGK